MRGVVIGDFACAWASMEWRLNCLTFERLNQESKNVEECDLLRYASCKAKVLLDGVACDCGTSSSWLRGSVCVRIAYKEVYIFAIIMHMI